jgi:MFS family permease
VRESLEQVHARVDGHVRELVAGLRLVVSSSPLLTVLVAWSIVMLSNAAVNVAEVFLAVEVFDAGDIGYGILVAAGALGLVLGSFSAGGLIDRHGVRGPYGLAIAVMGAGLLAAAGSPSLWVAIPFVVLSGVGNGAAVVCNVVLVQRGAPDALRGRAFSVLMGIGYGVLGLGMVLAGPFTNAYGARTAWVVASGLCAVGALVGFVLLAPDEPRLEEPA